MILGCDSEDIRLSIGTWDVYMPPLHELYVPASSSSSWLFSSSLSSISVLASPSIMVVSPARQYLARSSLYLSALVRASSPRVRAGCFLRTCRLELLDRCNGTINKCNWHQDRSRYDLLRGLGGLESLQSASTQSEFTRAWRHCLLTFVSTLPRRLWLLGRTVADRV